MEPAFTRRRHVVAGARPLPIIVTSPAPNRLTLGLLVVMTVAYGLFFGWLSLERYWTFQTHALDLGNMGQAAWNTIHGRPFRFTNMRLPYRIEAWGTVTRLSFHVEALFPVIALVYLIYPHPESLLVLQTVAIALGAIPTYALARRVLDSDWFGLLFAALYLLYPSVEGMNLYEFHPVALATPLLLFAFLFLYTGRTIPFVLASLAAIGTKEELGLVVALFGLYGALFLRRRRVGLTLAAIGIFWSLFATLVVEHRFRQPGALTYIHTRYAWLFGPRNAALANALHTLRTDPGAVLRILFTWPKLAYLVRLLAPVGYLALLSPAALLLAAPTLALNLFSGDLHMYSGLGQDSAEILSAVIIAAILGTKTLLRALPGRLDPRRASLLVGAYLAVAGLAYQRADGFTPLGARFRPPVMTAHARVQQRFVGMIPAGVPVSTQDQLDPALSSRAWLYLFEDLGGRTLPGAPNARYVLLDASRPTYPLPSYQLYDRAVALLRRGWHVQAAGDGLILLRPGPGPRTPPPSFYRFARASGPPPARRLDLAYGGIRVVGAGRVDQMQPNHSIPEVQYRLFMRRVASNRRAVEPVVFETVGERMIACSADALGLPWFPTPRWDRGTTYAFTMSPIETRWNQPGTARFWVELTPALPHDPMQRDCSRLWSRRGQLAPIGDLPLRF